MGGGSLTISTTRDARIGLPFPHEMEHWKTSFNKLFSNGGTAEIALESVKIADIMHGLTPYTAVNFQGIIRIAAKKFPFFFTQEYLRATHREAAAQALMNLLNHAPPLVSAEDFALECSLLKTHLRVLARRVTPNGRFDRRSVIHAIRLLDDGAGKGGVFARILRPPDKKFGVNFSAYLQAKRIVASEWDQFGSGAREKAIAEELRRQLSDAGPRHPWTAELRDPGTAEMTARPEVLMGRPLYVTPLRQEFAATLLLFEVLAMYENQYGGVFLPARFPGDILARMMQDYRMNPCAENFKRAFGFPGRNSIYEDYGGI